MDMPINARNLFRQTLIDLGIHATQIADGFNLETTGSYHTVPGVYQPAEIIPALTNAFRLFNVTYTVDGLRRYVGSTRFCHSTIARALIPNLDTTDPIIAARYIIDLHNNVAHFLVANGISATPQTIGTLMALATYRCPGHTSGTITALPHCTGDTAYNDVYLPFLRAGANLTTIIIACANRIGNPLPTSYLMQHTPVRYGVLNMHENRDTLATIKLGIYGD